MSRGEIAASRFFIYPPKFPCLRHSVHSSIILKTPKAWLEKKSLKCPFPFFFTRQITWLTMRLQRMHTQKMEQSLILKKGYKLSISVEQVWGSGHAWVKYRLGARWNRWGWVNLTVILSSPFMSSSPRLRSLIVSETRLFPFVRSRSGKVWYIRERWELIENVCVWIFCERFVSANRIFRTFVSTEEQSVRGLVLSGPDRV